MLAQPKNKKMITKTKKPTKYHYFFNYDRGNYFQISRGLEKRYRKAFYGSGIHLTEKAFDLHFYCTAKEYKRIVACARRRYGKIKSVSRYTNKEYNGE
jgi:hypothetical protein